MRTDCILPCRCHTLDCRRRRVNGHDIKMEAILTLGGRHFGSGYSLSCHCNARTELSILPSCYMIPVVSYLLLDITVSCEPMDVSEATSQLLPCLAFNLCNLRLFETELQPGVGLNFQWNRAKLSWLQLRTQLRWAPVDLRRAERRPSCFDGWQQNSPALIIHACTAQPSCIVCLGRISNY